MNLAEVWNHLEAETHIADVPGRVQRRIAAFAGRRDFFLGLETPSRNRSAHTPRCGELGVEGLPEIPNSRGSERPRGGQRRPRSDEAEVVLGPHGFGTPGHL